MRFQRDIRVNRLATAGAVQALCLLWAFNSMRRLTAIGENAYFSRIFEANMTGWIAKLNWPAPHRTIRPRPHRPSRGALTGVEAPLFTGSVQDEIAL